MMNRTEGRAAPLLWLRMLALLSSIMACAQLHAEAASSPDPLFDQPYVDIDEWRDTPCLLYTSDAADDLLCVDLGGRRIIKKKLT